MDLTNGERAVISILVQQLEGVDKSGARMVVSISDKLDLNNQQSFAAAEQDETDNYDIANVEILWIRDLLRDAFNARRVPPFISKHALSLSEKLEEYDGA